MRKVILTSTLAFLVVMGSAPTRADDPLSGRVTYIDLNKHRIMLDNAYLYAVDSRVNLRNLAMADVVKVKTVERGGRPIVDKITEIE